MLEKNFCRKKLTYFSTKKEILRFQSKQQKRKDKKQLFKDKINVFHLKQKFVTKVLYSRFVWYSPT